MRRFVVLSAMVLVLGGAAHADAASPYGIRSAIRAQGGEVADAVILGGDHVMFGRYDEQGFKVILHGCDGDASASCDKVEMISCLPFEASVSDAVMAAQRYNLDHEIGTAFAEPYGTAVHACLRFTTLHTEGQDFGGVELVFWRQIFANLKQMVRIDRAQSAATPKSN